MKKSLPARRKVATAAAILVSSLFAQAALGVTITVRDGAGAAVTTPVRWVLQEDRTFDVIPGVTGTSAATGDTLSLRFHRSYMPVVATGTSSGATIAIANGSLSLSKRYFLSVLPAADGAGNGLYSMTGIPIRPVNGAWPTTTLTAVVDNLPMKTAQISVLVYHDANPVNAQHDSIGAQEHGLCGFEVHVYDAGGTYGASGGRISTDTYGNPLGTEYPGGDLNNPVIGSMILKTDANGVVRIRNLAPGKYTVYPFQPQVKPSQAECPGYYPGPGGEPPLTPWPESGVWLGTSTIEGTQGDDAWVKANEPAYFKEFGPPGHHVVKGFAAQAVDAAALNGAGAVTGRVVNIHMSRPPNFAFYNGRAVEQCRVALNEWTSATAAAGRAIWAGPCNPDGTFTIPGTRPNTRYQLAVWDEPLDNIFASYDFVTDASGNLHLQDVPVFNWFGFMVGKVCQDPDEIGYCGPDSVGIAGQAINLRFRDGSIYQSTATQEDGTYELPEIFPFFNWLVAEVDFARFKATGMTAVVDAGGPLAAGARTTPQPQFVPGTTTPINNPNTGNNLSRTETGPVLLQGVQAFLGLTNRLDWGKRPYPAGENGGITGIVRYSSTRAESDPRLAAAENNEPGIPGVTVQLFLANPANPRQIHPGQPNPVAQVTTDSWDASQPTGCQGPVFTINGITTDCFDGLRNFNQVRNALFDGGYAFVTYEPNGVGTGGDLPLPAGNYIVKVIPPPGYEIQKEEDKNVDFGDYYGVSTLALPPECVGVRTSPVPAELTLFPGVPIPAEYRDAPGKPRPLCNMKAVPLAQGQNAAADFALFTTVPVAGHIVGFVLDDTASEFAPTAPTFGEKFAPPFMPVSLRDMAGREFSRVYTDRYGAYNALVPSTFTFNVPMPSGVSPNMIQACLNPPFMTDPVTGLKTPDPHYNKSYSQFCYNFQYLPGKTTYLDTPVVPIAAFAGPQQFALDCEQPDLVPAIRSVSNAANQGPWLASSSSGTARRLTITSMGTRQVLNPLYNADNPTAGVPKFITRDYGFGTTPGTVSVNGFNLPASVGIPVFGGVVSWSDSAIVVQLPTSGGNANGGQMLVTRGGANGKTTVRGVNVHVSATAPTVVGTPGNATIQAAIDNTPAGGLVTVPPGLYEERVIIDKRVRVQGFGAGGTLLNPVAQPTESVQQWRADLCTRLLPDITAGTSPRLLPGQAVPPSYQACLDGNVADNAPLLFGDMEAPGFFVLDRSDSNKTQGLLIDGFTIAGADLGGGIAVNGYASGLEIANNLITGNQGIRAGGIRIGHPDLTTVVADGPILPVRSQNFLVNIHHNEITQNGNTAAEVGGGGGGIGMFFGNDGYRVSRNFICGNYSSGNGGGMAHVGVNLGGTIEFNDFLWNQSFYQGNSVQGGGLSITGATSLAAAAAGEPGLTTGTGNVMVNANTFQGNVAAAGDGGAIYLGGVNGNEVATVAGVGLAYRVDIFNNIIVNNVAAVAGGGIALVDSPNVRIVHNTIARNDSAAVAARTFNLGLTQGLANGLSNSTAQPGAGIASYLTSPALAARIGSGFSVPDPSLGGTTRTLSSQFSNAVLLNNLLVESRQFNFTFNFVNNDPTNPNCLVNNGTNACYSLVPVAANANTNVAVVGNTGLLGTWDNQTNWTSSTISNSGLSFSSQYFNGPRDAIILDPETTTKNLSVAAAFDEGGNFIDLRYGPLSLYRPTPTPTVPWGNYHLTPGNTTTGITPSGAFLLSAPELLRDRDNLLRATNGGWVRGAYNTTRASGAPL